MSEPSAAAAGGAAGTVLQLADIHLRADGGRVLGEDPAHRLRLVLEACRRELAAPGLVLLSGDQADDDSAEALREVLEMVGAAFDAPILAIPGNHDGPAAQREVFGAPHPAELGGWRVLGLDSCVPGEIHGSLDATAVAARLDALDRRPTLLAMHHPPVPPTTHRWFQLEHAEALLATLAERPHVRGVLSGHVHCAFARERGPLRLLGAPSVLAPFRFEGEELITGAGGPTGARTVALAADGTLASRLIEA